MNIQPMKNPLIMKQLINFSIKTPLFLFLTVLFGVNSAAAQQYTFQVNMEHIQLGPGDKVAVRGNVAVLGNWEEEGQLMLRKEGNSQIYSANLDPSKVLSANVLYKYVIIRRDGTEQWEERGNRVLNPTNSEPVWFNDRTTAGIQQTLVQVTVQLDLTEHSMNGYPAEAVAIMGAHAPLGWDMDTERTELTEISEGIWTTRVNFPFGTPHDVPFKFGWKHNDEWMWEWRAGHSNHVFLIDDSYTEQSIALRYDVDKPGVVPTDGTSGSVDDYDAVLARLGDKSGQSRYQYEKAMKLLEQGNLEEANQTYARYKTAHPGGEEIDDFAYRMVYALEKSQGYEAAQAYLKTQQQTETIPERKVYFTYLEGELALHAGKRNIARNAFNKVMQENKWDIATEYSQKAMVHSYLTEDEPDSIKKGVVLLEQEAARAPETEQRDYAVRLSRAYRAAGMKDKQEQALIKIATTGTEHQRATGKVELARTYMRNGKYTEALGFLDSVNEEFLVERDKLQKTRLQIELYHELEMHNEVATLYEEYERNHPEDPFRKRLEAFKKNAEQKLGTDRINIPQNAASPDSTSNKEPE